MKTILIICIATVIIFCMTSSTFAQNDFDVQKYGTFLQNNENLTSTELLPRHAAKTTYYKGRENEIPPNEVSYLDSVTIKYNLTESELDLLKQNHFVVTERLRFDCFGRALHDIYGKDLPVFITTDAILHALHYSYDQILKDIEIGILEPNLDKFLDALSNSLPELVNKYDSNELMHDALCDVDLYVTMAKSLLDDRLLSPKYTSQETVSAVWEAVQAEKMVEMPLFSERDRKLDFSQFTVRGHYASTETSKPLGPYFKCMMWIGRMSFLLTPPPSWEKEEVRRMNLGAVLLNELVVISGAQPLLDENDDIITFMVGESDNLTPSELAEIIVSEDITLADGLLDDSKYAAFQEALLASAGSGQRILSNFFIMDPFSTTPDILPVSYQLMGQRFIIDSYIFSNLVYDRIIHDNKKIWRPMPDPLDAMFVLGNDDALPLLKEQLDTYKYSSQLSALRYLTDAYDPDFWDLSLYNVWLQALRFLNPPEDKTGFPFFMQTTAWHQEKLNTQLASWAQLRHDNLLYAKQSYTGGIACSYPHSFVEPYPEFYRQIAAFAEKAETYFAKFTNNTWEINCVKEYFPRLKNIVLQLEVIAQKELDRLPLSNDETEFLKRMLFQETGSGAPPFSGWYAELFYFMKDAAEIDYVVADVHTQPTDQFGGVVGRILHVGVGNVNLGVFLADSPSADYRPMAFVGPVMSYYEKITDDFDRLTDERWKSLVESGELPVRPDWVNIYCTDSDGNVREKGRELDGVMYSITGVEDTVKPEELRIIRNYPNPFNPETTIEFTLPNESFINLSIYNIMGQKVHELAPVTLSAGTHTVRWDGTSDSGQSVSSGVYIARITMGENVATRSMMLLK